VPVPGLVACGAGSGGWVRCAGLVSPALGVLAALAGQADGGQVSLPAAARLRLPCLAGAGSWPRPAPPVRCRGGGPLRPGLRGGGWTA